MRLLILICGICVLFFQNTRAQTNVVFEAEKAVLSGSAQVTTCNNASGGEMVKGLDNGSANSLLFDKITIDEAGDYFISLSYYSTAERNLTYKLNNGEEQQQTVAASGEWCYQGGTPADHIFKVQLNSGDNTILFYNSPIIDKIVVLSDTTARQASAIYVSSSTGNDLNDGLTPETAINTLGRLNYFSLVPGDSIFFKAGDTFVGKLQVQNESGTLENPIYFGKYGAGDLPLIDGDAYLATIHVLNSEYLHFNHIEITNNGGEAKPGDPDDLRYGIYIQNSLSDGSRFKHYRMNGMVFRNIYPTVDVTDDDNTGVNAHAIFTSGSWGDEINPLRFEDMQVTNCYFTRTARHALVIKSTKDLIIKNNYFEHVGGAGMVIGNACENILIEHNITDHTGSSIDSRMAGRGSGVWCFRTKNLRVQHNQFMFARGIHDSYGMHIDIGNRNVVYQYNYSVGNEGGFVEILGMNVNVGYRYNLSIADGWRKRGNRHGQIFWLAGWSGDPKNPVGSDSIFVYNNSVYVPDTITPGIWIENVSKNARIYNNIIHAEHDFGPVEIRNEATFNKFDHNIWYGNIPATDEDGDAYRGANASVENPLYADAIVTDSSGFKLQAGSPALGSGKLIFNAETVTAFDAYDNHGGRDYFGNLVSESEQPNRGADNGDKITALNSTPFGNKNLRVFPNPVKQGGKLNYVVASIKTGDVYAYQIIDLSGKVQYLKQGLLDKSGVINTKELKPGIYFLKVSGKNSIQIKQFVVY